MYQRLSWSSVFLAVTAFLAVVLNWAYQGFRLRLIGGASAALGQCQSMTTEPISHFTSIHALYSGFQVPYCVVYQLTNGSIVAWFGVQITMWVLAVLLVYRAGSVMLNRRAGLVAGFSLAILWETFRFAVRAQSDMAFIFVFAVTLWALAVFDQNPTKGHLGIVVVSLALLAVTRPFGPAIVMGLVAFQLVGPDYHSRFQLDTLMSVVVGVLMIAATYFFITRWFLFDIPSEYSLTQVSWRTSHLASWAQGIVVTHTTQPTFQHVYDVRHATNTFEFMLYNADHLIVLSLMKIVWFFIPVLSRWSMFHIMVNLVTLLPIIIGTFIGAYLTIQRRDYRIIHFLLVPLCGILAPILIAYIDGGFNYRAPATLLFALLTGYAVTTPPLKSVFDSLITRLPGAGLW